jgi:putative aldouronate transport system permease protein
MAQTATSQSTVQSAWKHKWKKISQHLPLFLMTLPGFIYLIINNYLPIYGIQIAFKTVDYQKGVFNGDWIGLQNFMYLFKTRDAFIITRNTILYNVLFIILNTVVAIAVAIMLNEIKNKALLKFNQTIILLPHLISMVIIAYLAYAVLSIDNGFMNKTILPALGLKEISWYTESKYWPLILPVVNLWKGFGYLSIIYMATIIGIDTEYYEAADLDGATSWQKITNITLPLIKPVITMMVLLDIGRIFHSDFGLFYQIPMNSGAIYSTTNVIDTYVYRGLMQLGDIGMSSAAGVYQSVVGFILVIVSNAIVRKYDSENALF